MKKHELINFLMKKKGIGKGEMARLLGVSRQQLYSSLQKPWKAKKNDTNLSLLRIAFEDGYFDEAMAFIREGSRAPLPPLRVVSRRPNPHY